MADGRFRRPAALTRSSSINALAMSLGKPYATMHRFVLELIRCGWIVPVGQGVALSNAPDRADRIVAMMTLAHDSLVRLAEDLSADLSFPAPTRAATADLPHHVLRAALDIWLVPFEYAREPVIDWTDKLIWIVIVVANVRHITIDPVLAERYAHDPTPDDLRRPMAVRTIARLTGLSYGTAFRHCKALAALDVIRYDRGGWLLVSRQLNHEKVDQGVVALLEYFEKRIGELVPHGFDPAAAGSFYREGRPPYAAVDG